MDDVIGVAVRLGEDQRFGCLFAVGEYTGFNRSLHGFDDLPNLAGVDYGTVQFLAGVRRVFLGFCPALFTGLAVAVVNPLFCFEFGAFLGDFGFDLVDIVTDVDPIDHGLLVGVFGDDVLIEKTKGALVGSGGQADEEGIEIIQDLLPQVVNRAVAFIHNDEIEGFNRYVGIVTYKLGLLVDLLNFIE